jgi:hypothetical protein
MHKLLAAFFTYIVMASCSNKPSNDSSNSGAMVKIFPNDDFSSTNAALFKTDTVTIASKKYVLSVLKSDAASAFTVQKLIDGRFKIILEEPEFYTNNSTLFFHDQNYDGYLDIVWRKKWQEHAYLFNPKIENFIEVGEFHSVNVLKVNDQPVLYRNRFPLLYYWNYEKQFTTTPCGIDTVFIENHSELFAIDENFHKVSFAVLDNFTTLRHSNLACGQQIVICSVPPYVGLYGENSIWSRGVVIDSFLLKGNGFSFSDKAFTTDSNFISNYWRKNFAKLLPYGELFNVRRTQPLKYTK